MYEYIVRARIWNVQVSLIWRLSRYYIQGKSSWGWISMGFKGPESSCWQARSLFVLLSRHRENLNALDRTVGQNLGVYTMLSQAQDILQG